MENISGTQNLSKNLKVVPSKGTILKIVVYIVLVGFVTSVLYHFVYQGIFLGMKYPYNTFLFDPNDRFNDYFNLWECSKNRNPYFAPTFINSNYLPFSNFIFWIFSFFPKQLSLILFIGIFSALIYFFTFINIPKSHSNFKRHLFAFVISFLTYPYLTAVDRSNLEPYVVIFIMAFLFFYLKKQHHLAILFLAMAAATKLYPLIFILLYVSDKEYKKVALTVLCFVVLVISPLLLQQGGFHENLYFILNGFEPDLTTVLGDKGNLMLQGTSLFSSLKLVNIKLGLGLTNMLGKYFLMVAIIAIFPIFYVVFIEKVLWRKVTLLTCLIIILPHVSFDYKFLHVLYCFYLFINEPETDHDNKLNYRTIAVIFGLLFISKSYYYFSGILTFSNRNDVPLGTLINPLLILFLIFIIMKAGIKNYHFSNFKIVIQEHVFALKRSLGYILPLGLILIPYVSYSAKAKKGYGEYQMHYFKAKEYTDNNRSIEAIAELKHAFQIKPYKYKITLQIAQLYYEMENRDSATVFFNKTLLILPECKEAQYGVLSIDIEKNNEKAADLFKNNKIEEAILFFNEARNSVLRLPHSAYNTEYLIGIITNICICNMNLQKWNEAEINLKQIAGLDPNNMFLKENKDYVEKMNNLDGAL